MGRIHLSLGLGWCLAGAGEGAGGEEAAGVDDVVEAGAGDEGTTGGVAGGMATETGVGGGAEAGIPGGGRVDADLVVIGAGVRYVDLCSSNMIWLTKGVIFRI